MPIPCRNFDNDGQPIGKRGCTKGASCMFLHPDNPAWAQAIRRRKSDANSNRSSGPSNSRGNGSRGGPPKSPSKDWDPSLWGSSSGTSKKSDEAPTLINWGSERQGTTAEPPSSNGWTGTSDKAEASWSWGTNTTSGWVVDKNVGWGAGGDGESVGGGGSWVIGAGGGWGNDGAHELGGGKAGDNTSTASHSNDMKGKRKETQREDVEMRNLSPPKTANESIQPSHRTQSAAAPTPNTVALKVPRPFPLLLPTRQKPVEDGSLAKLALQCLQKSDKETEKVLVNSPETQLQTKPTSLPNQTVRGPIGRVNLFSQAIKHTSAIVHLQLELQRAQRDHARWKRTQESSQYERASHATRVILDHHRAQLNLRVQEAKRRLDRAMTALVELPDVAPRNRKIPGPILTKQTIAAYTAELRDWFLDLELHKRILMEKAAAQADLPPAPVQDESAAPVEPQLTARQLVERGKWSWNDIKITVNELDTRVLNIAEHLYSNVYTTMDDFKHQVAGLQDPCQMNPPVTRGNQSGALLSTTSLVGDNISAQAIRAADLISKIHELEQEDEHLKNEKRAMETLCAEAEVHFSQFEEWGQDDRVKIQEMVEQLRTLHLRCKSPTPLTATLQPSQLDGILVHMQPTVVAHLHKEVQPIFDALRSRCLESHEGMKKSIDELIRPALVMTDDICHRVSTVSFADSK